MTRIMIVVLTTFFLTWLFFAGICYITTDLSYKQCLNEVTAPLFMYGWLPAAVVAGDLIALTNGNRKLNRVR